MPQSKACRATERQDLIWFLRYKLTRRPKKFPLEVIFAVECNVPNYLSLVSDWKFSLIFLLQCNFDRLNVTELSPQNLQVEIPSALKYISYTFGSVWFQRYAYTNISILMKIRSIIPWLKTNVGTKQSCNYHVIILWRQATVWHQTDAMLSGSWWTDCVGHP